MSNAEEYLTIDEVASLMRVGRTTVYRMAQRGELPATKFGRAWRFSREKLNKYLEQHTHS
jgi:excisionase family DNA binding protein|tara:strand:- start:1158 stop:1337 length:180 start_codon:yes stop_codon:yes gene_type:complete